MKRVMRARAKRVRPENILHGAQFLSLTSLSEPQQEIQDVTEQDLINLRRQLYLTIMSSLDFEECAHKIMKIRIPEGSEVGQMANIPASGSISFTNNSTLFVADGVVHDAD